MTLQAQVLADCRRALPGWRALTEADVAFDPPKGFSTFTMGVRPRVPVDPPAILYRRLAGKDNAILDHAAERSVYLALSDADIAARCHHYEADFRLEAFYVGRTLTADDLTDPGVLRGIGGQLARLHRLEPPDVPSQPFFERLPERWEPLARRTLVERKAELPDDEQALCEPLLSLFDADTRRRVAQLVPDGPRTFCHNDTYHGNVMRLADGAIRLLDFEFSCLNHRAFDLANLFAETVMVHGLPEPPHFRIAAPTVTDRELRILAAAVIGDDDGDVDALVAQARQMIPLSDYMYAMAALPLALEPVQTIRFLPYAHQRFTRFLAATEG